MKKYKQRVELQCTLGVRNDITHRVDDGAGGVTPSKGIVAVGSYYQIWQRVERERVVTRPEYRHCTGRQQS